jgi:hypothetical protein
LCPRCAFEAYSEGRISCPTPESINNIAAVAIVLMDDVVASGPGADLFMDPEAYLKAGLN